jgi:hypothetical protein
VRLALRGRRNMDGGAEAITDADVRAAVRRQARRVLVRAVLATAAATAFYLWIS